MRYPVTMAGMIRMMAYLSQFLKALKTAALPPWRLRAGAMCAAAALIIIIFSGLSEA
jgi:hypothetical protein